MDENELRDSLGVSSATDCTGLMPRPPLDDEEYSSYLDLYQTETSEKGEP